MSPSREEGIARYGGRDTTRPGGYDDSVRRCAADAANGWRFRRRHLDEGEHPGRWPRDARLRRARRGNPGAGRRRAAVHPRLRPGRRRRARRRCRAVLWQRLGPNCPRLIVVEPERADCIFRAVVAGQPVSIEGSTDTFMACLAAGEAITGRLGGSARHDRRRAGPPMRRPPRPCACSRPARTATHRSPQIRRCRPPA